MRLETSVHAARADVGTQGKAIEGLVLAHLNGGTNPLDGTPEAQWQARLASLFVAELQGKPHYAQFRLIGVADGGREIVRADRMGLAGDIRVAPPSELQRKADRDYFVANGRELADELVKRRPSVRVLFTSGYTEDAIVHHGRLDPGVLLLAKPYRKSDLDRMIREALSASGDYGKAVAAG
jgi:hypothetical protein